MKRYKCIKNLCVERCDEDGFLIENSSVEIEKGKIYELDESGYMLVGGKDHVHLDAIDDDSWLEIARECLEEYFKLLEVE